MTSLDLAIIGNCNIGALIDKTARVVWTCLPRFDGDPRFCALLDDGKEITKGFFDISLEGFVRSEQHYRRNSAVLVTTLYDATGGVIEVTDFAPRFKQFGRVFRPQMLVRQIKPLAGAPSIRVRLRPAHDYGRHEPEVTRGSNHIRYIMPDLTLRMTTDGPLTYIQEEVPFIVEQPITLVFGHDESFTSSVTNMGREFLEQTDDYWKEWCRYLSLPFEWQDAVVRAAITLKLCNFEETGAIVAALTTSIPEAADSGRNWDYRFCWLRDSYFVVHALNALGVTRTMEGYLSYITNIVASSEDGYMQPLFGIARETMLAEREETHLPGYRGMGPVRVGNSAYDQVQNDGYGSVVLSCAQSFFDHRLTRMGDEALFLRLERLGEQSKQRWDQPDAGLWELRTRQDIHTYSSVMCWAACDRLSKIAAHLKLPKRASYWRKAADKVHRGTLEQAWNSDLESFTATFGGDQADASMLLLPQLGFLAANDPRYVKTLGFVESQLRRGDHVFRYANRDDFGVPETAFNVCSFWYIDALASVGRKDEARELFQNMIASRNSLGLLSEDIVPQTGELWGNFPQTYSMVGLIHSAMKLSLPWEDAF